MAVINPKLKKAYRSEEFTPYERDETLRCMRDPYYFITTYYHIRTPDGDDLVFEPFEYQKKMIRAMIDNRRVICKMPRQSGKSTVVVAFLLYMMLFHDEQQILLLSKDEASAKDLLRRFKFAYERLPTWLQVGIVTNDVTRMELENGSLIQVSGTTLTSGRGLSPSIVFLDEFAFISGNIAPEFMKSVYPTISAGKRTKIIMVSTPRGMNHFFRLWDDASKGKNGFTPIDVHWTEHPDRDDTWAAEQKQVLGEDGFAQEYGCEFMGSSGTLIAPSVLRTLVPVEPVLTSAGFHAFNLPEPGHRYVVVADVAEGIGQDYSAASVFDVTQKPYKQVARYYDNRVSIVDYPNILYSIGMRYNEAYILIEIGGGSIGVGDQVASVLRYELEYENLFVTTEGVTRGFQKQAQELVFGFGPGKKFGIKTTKATKRRGCVNLKDLIEQRTLIVQDADTIRELTNFIKVGDSFEADEGDHDDLAMTLALFGWLVKQENFEAITDTTVQRRMSETSDLPFPMYVSDGREEESEIWVKDGDVWFASKFTGWC